MQYQYSNQLTLFWYNQQSKKRLNMCQVRQQPLRSVHVSDLRGQQSSPSETRTGVQFLKVVILLATSVIRLRGKLLFLTPTGVWEFICLIGILGFWSWWFSDWGWCQADMPAADLERKKYQALQVLVSLDCRRFSLNTIDLHHSFNVFCLLKPAINQYKQAYHAPGSK